ncbi:MAG: DUF86 domain-containing protein [Pseudonocardia sp.]|nr:DUF86 domain-containing protein [Pseudonocardia sp.]
MSETTKARFPEVPWRNPARLRNRVVHGYWSVDIGILHTTASEQLGEFVRQLRRAVVELTAEAETRTASDSGSAEPDE